MKKNLKEYVGKRVKVIANAAGHNISIGTVCTVTSAANINSIRVKEYPNLVFYQNDVEICPETREDIEKSITEKEVEITDLRNKLAYMTENGLEEFDETQYKVLETLKTLDKPDLSQLEKSKIIAKLIQND